MRKATNRRGKKYSHGLFFGVWELLFFSIKVNIGVDLPNYPRDRQTDRQTDRHRQKQRQRDTDTGTQRETETDRQTDRQTDREKPPLHL